MNRLQMYAAVYAFERDIRAIIRSYLDDGHGLEELMGDEDREKLQERHARAQKSGQTVDPVDLLDLRPSYDLLNRHRAELPSELAAEVRANTDRLDVLVPIRQRLMHARPLAPEDPERLLSSLYCFTHPRWKATHAVLEAVGDPTWVPDVEPELVPDAVLHNLPAADYDETGLIGRSVKASEIAQMLISGRESVLTLTGEGGIGKTALALDVAYRLVEEIDPPFEVILWVSLKQERLTGMGVLQIRNSINSLSDAAEHMGRGIDPTFSGGVSDLAAALEGIRALVCLDNLESVSGDEFVALYEAMPATVKYLVTSRNGIGQIERRVNLGPLESKHAVALLSKLIKRRSVSSLEGLSSTARSQIVDELRGSPLGIKWWVLACAAGRPPAELIKDQSELLSFCVRSVYESLSAGAQRIAVALDVLSGEAPLHRISVLTGGGVNDSATWLQELVRGSLVQSRIEFSASMETLVSLTETAKRYLRIAVPSGDPDRVAMIEADATFREDEARRARDVSARILDPVVVHHRYPSDAPTCQKLRRAIIVSRSGYISAARALINECRAMSPDFWEVDRVSAFIESFHLAPEAVSALYLEALSKCSEDEHRAICSHFFSGHLARNVKDVAASLERAEFAHEHLGVAETLLALGNAQLRVGLYGSSVSSLQEARGALDGKARLIAVTSLVSAYRRWSEFCISEEHNLVTAYGKAVEGLKFGLGEIVGGVVDQKLLLATADVGNQLVVVARNMEESGVELVPLEWPELPNNLSGRLGVHVAWKEFGWRLRALDESTRRSLGLAVLEEMAVEGEQREGSELDGHLLSVHDGFGFIAHPDYPRNVFFHASAVRGNWSDLEPGRAVRFVPTRDDEGRDRAEWVEMRDLA